MGKTKTYGAHDWVSTKIGVEPATDSDKKEYLLARPRFDSDEEFEQDTGSNKSLCVSMCVLAFSVPALIGA